MSGKNIQISFHRKKFSKSTCDYLCNKLDENEDLETIAQLKGLTNKTISKLKVKEANELVIKILQAIIIDDDLVTTDEENDIDETESNMVYILFTTSKESRKNFYSCQDLNPGPRPQFKSDDLDRMAIRPAI